MLGIVKKGELSWYLNFRIVIRSVFIKKLKLDYILRFLKKLL